MYSSNLSLLSSLYFFPKTLESAIFFGFNTAESLSLTEAVICRSEVLYGIADRKKVQWTLIGTIMYPSGSKMGVFCGLKVNQLIGRLGKYSRGVQRSFIMTFK